LKNFFFFEYLRVIAEIPKGKMQKEKLKMEGKWKRQIDEMFSTLIEIYIALEKALSQLRGGNSKMQFQL
jgi:hypothetical protein